MSRGTRVALYGGAFNPPHLAHIFTITYLLGREDVDQVWVIPTATHVFGKEMAPVDDRIAMVQDIVQTYGWGDRVQVLDIEARRDGPSRTFDTLSQLTNQWPNHEFRWVMGADNLTERHRWHRFDELVERWDLIVLGRPGHDAALTESAQAKWCHPGPTLPAVSSTQLRDAIRGIGPSDRLAWLPHCVRDRSLALYHRENTPLPSVMILGLGRLGQTWSACLTQAGHPPATWNRTPIAGADTSDELPLNIASDTVIITVTDTAISNVAEQLADRLSEGERPTVLHCAGRLGNEVLKPLADKGCAVGSIHPLQSVTGGAADLYGAYCALSGDQTAVTRAKQLVAAAGAISIELPTDDKAAYHASAVLSANFITTLASGGIELLKSLGVPETDAARILNPLALGTVQHLKERSPVDTLTGPFARRDIEAVKAHIKSIDERAPDLLESYRALARATARMMKWSKTECEALDDVLDA